MKIQSVGIKNFRSLKDVEITFDSVTTLIGPNGTGKSTVLRALDWFFNAGKGGELSQRDCSFGATDQDIEVRVTFSDLTAKDREALGKYAPSDAATFTAWKTHKVDGTEALSANSKSYPPFAEIRSKGSAADKKTAYNALRSGDESLGLPAWTNQDTAEESMTTWEATNTDKLVESPSDLQTNFFGFNSSMELQYRGRLDASRKEAAPAGIRRDLYEAMKQVVETGQGPRDQVASMGCSIKWKDAA